MNAEPQMITLEKTYPGNLVIVFCSEQMCSELNRENAIDMLRRILTVPSEPECPSAESSSKTAAEVPTMAKITKVLHELGMPANLLGYSYLCFAVDAILADSTSLRGVTKVLYPEIAREYNTSVSGVERAIRHAIEVAFDRGDRKAFRKRFGNTVNPDTGKPTNSEFISKIAESIRSEA